MIFFLMVVAVLLTFASSQVAKDPTTCLGFGYEILAARLDSLDNSIIKTDLSNKENNINLRREILELKKHLIETECGRRTVLPAACDQVESQKSGRYRLDVSPGLGQPIDVLCDQDFEGGGWLVFQNRFNGDVDFYRGWNEYKAGFGSLDGEFWLGLDKLHEITYSNKYELAVLLEDFQGERSVARYTNFAIGGESQNYSLETLGSYSGTANDSLSYHKGFAFSTFDRDNDAHSTHCAVNYIGAWWYGACHLSNLNSRYGSTGEPNKIVVWRHWKGDSHALKKTRMMIRRVLA